MRDGSAGGGVRQTRRLLAALLASQCAIGAALAHEAPQTAPQSPVQVYRLETRDEALIRELAEAHGHLRVDRRKGVVLFDGSADEVRALRAKGLGLQVDPVLSAALQAASRPARAKGIAGFGCYRTVAETSERLRALSELHPQLVEIVDLGPGWEAQAGLTGGERLTVLRLGRRDRPGPRPSLFAMSAVHAREYTTAELMLRFAESLLDGYGRDADASWVLDHHDIHLLVQANPDGRKQAETGALWRKNTNQAYCGPTSSSRGADLNRNFPRSWGSVNGGSSGNVCASTYRGPAPASEPETRAIVAYVRSLFPDRRGPGDAEPAPIDTQGLFLDVHSYSELVLWPWGTTLQRAPNGDALEQMGRRFAWFNGYTPQQSVSLYPTDGTTDDFAYGELGVPAFTFELGTAFFQDCGSFEQRVLPDNLAALRYAMRLLHAPYEFGFGPEVVELRVQPDLALPGETIRLSAQVDDTRSSAIGGALPAQNISGARVYRGELPWQQGAQGLALQAEDGALDSPRETLSLELSDQQSGRELLLVQGSDSGDRVGPPSGVFVEVREAAEIAELQGVARQRGSGQTLAGARIEVDGWKAQSDEDGRYQRRVPIESRSLVAQAVGHEALRLDDLQLAAGSNTLDLQLYALCARLETDAEQGAQGWQAQTPVGTASWAISANSPAGGGATWHDSPGGTYANNADQRLLSPSFDLRGYESPVLRLRSWCDTEAGYDFGQIQVRSGPQAPWSTVYSCSGDPAWRSLEIALPQLAGAAEAELRLRLTSDNSVTADGWYVDALRIEAGGSLCRAQQDGLPFWDGFESVR